MIALLNSTTATAAGSRPLWMLVVMVAAFPVLFYLAAAIVACFEKK